MFTTNPANTCQADQRPPTVTITQPSQPTLTHSLRTPTIITAVAVIVLLSFAIVCTLVFFYRRHRRRQQQQTKSLARLEEPPLDNNESQGYPMMQPQNGVGSTEDMVLVPLSVIQNLLSNATNITSENQRQWLQQPHFDHSRRPPPLSPEEEERLQEIREASGTMLTNIDSAASSLPNIGGSSRLGAAPGHNDPFKDDIEI